MRKELISKFRARMFLPLAGISFLVFVTFSVLRADPQNDLLTDTANQSAETDALSPAPAPAPAVANDSAKKDLPASSPDPQPQAQPDNSVPTLNEVFSASNNPGRGKLIFSQGKVTETILLGKETGHYAIGLVFDLNRLPEGYQKEFGKKQVIQIAMGTSREKQDGRISQFGVASILTRTVPKEKKTYRLRLPFQSRQSAGEFGLLMFTSSLGMKRQSDEQQLRSSFFADSGTIVITPGGREGNLKIQTKQEEALAFKSQPIVVRIEGAKLVTPFNPEPAKLEGVIELPLYRPAEEKAHTLFDTLALQALTRSGMDPSSLRGRDLSSPESKGPPAATPSKE